MFEKLTPNKQEVLNYIASFGDDGVSEKDIFSALGNKEIELQFLFKNRYVVREVTDEDTARHNAYISNAKKSGIAILGSQPTPTGLYAVSTPGKEYLADMTAITLDEKKSLRKANLKSTIALCISIGALLVTFFANITQVADGCLWLLKLLGLAQ